MITDFSIPAGSARDFISIIVDGTLLCFAIVEDEHFPIDHVDVDIISDVQSFERLTLSNSTECVNVSTLPSCQILAGNVSIFFRTGLRVAPFQISNESGVQHGKIVDNVAINFFSL